MRGNLSSLLLFSLTPPDCFNFGLSLVGLGFNNFPLGSFKTFESCSYEPELNVCNSSHCCCNLNIFRRLITQLHLDDEVSMCKLV